MTKMLSLKSTKNPELKAMALRIQAAMRKQGLDVRLLTHRMGMRPDQHPAVRNWVAGKNGPGELWRAKLAEVLGLSEDELTWQGAHQKATPGPVVGPAQRAVVLARERLPAATPMGLPMGPPAATDVFVIRARSDGTMAVKLDTALPWAKGSQLVQYLLSFGLVIGAEAEGD
jgi:hypothetical protein